MREIRQAAGLAGRVTGDRWRAQNQIVLTEQNIRLSISRIKLLETLWTTVVLRSLER